MSYCHVVPRSAHTALARLSLGALLSLGDSIDKIGEKKHPLAIYAARRWVDHGKFEGVSSSIQDLVVRLFDKEPTLCDVGLDIRH